jgi:hypothetical protein
LWSIGIFTIQWVATHTHGHIATDTIDATEGSIHGAVRIVETLSTEILCPHLVLEAGQARVGAVVIGDTRWIFRVLHALGIPFVSKIHVFAAIKGNRAIESRARFVF